MSTRKRCVEPQEESPTALLTRVRSTGSLRRSPPQPCRSRLGPSPSSPSRSTSWQRERLRLILQVRPLLLIPPRSATLTLFASQPARPHAVFRPRGPGLALGAPHGVPAPLSHERALYARGVESGHARRGRMCVCRMLSRPTLTLTATLVMQTAGDESGESYTLESAVSLQRWRAMENGTAADLCPELAWVAPAPPSAPRTNVLSFVASARCTSRTQVKRRRPRRTARASAVRLQSTAPRWTRHAWTGSTHSSPCQRARSRRAGCEWGSGSRAR